MCISRNFALPITSIKKFHIIRSPENIEQCMHSTPAIRCHRHQEHSSSFVGKKGGYLAVHKQNTCYTVQQVHAIAAGTRLEVCFFSSRFTYKKRDPANGAKPASPPIKLISIALIVLIDTCKYIK